MSDAVPEGITTNLDHDTVSATGIVAATASDVLEYLRRPANHAEISGDGTVRGRRFGPDRLDAVGERFGMQMKMYGVPYRMTCKVVELDEGRAIAWRHPFGHTWRWQLEPVDGGTRVTETFDLSTARVPAALRLVGYPKGHQANVARSVANVRDHFAAG